MHYQGCYNFGRLDLHFIKIQSIDPFILILRMIFAQEEYFLSNLQKIFIKFKQKGQFSLNNENFYKVKSHINPFHLNTKYQSPKILFIFSLLNFLNSKDHAMLKKTYSVNYTAGIMITKP